MITITKSLYAIVMLCVTILLIQLLQICLTKDRGSVKEGFLSTADDSKLISKGDLKSVEATLESILKKVRDVSSFINKKSQGVRFAEQNEEDTDEENDAGKPPKKYLKYEDNGALIEDDEEGAVEGFIEGFTLNCAEM